MSKLRIYKEPVITIKVDTKINIAEIILNRNRLKILEENGTPKYCGRLNAMPYGVFGDKSFRRQLLGGERQVSGHKEGNRNLSEGSRRQKAAGRRQKADKAEENTG